ncbi:hypothetical protein RirG_202480 [Rhizophagus irregularis DAOM 197198w]|uniref:Uncharacterized protein n=1 Tax=Rhizophagus irregularis (strain DAOM 197198w) TaxID=1432141 RepID=A0A015LT94_RHIIW|nr:hypothetical protein RirG_202480 [Rhizophagus irregularis DAOM 197198w]
MFATRSQMRYVQSVIKYETSSKILKTGLAVISKLERKDQDILIVLKTLYNPGILTLEYINKV